MPAADLHRVGRAGGVVEVHAPGQPDGPVEPFDDELRRPVLRPGAVRVVQDQRAAQAVAVVEDDRAARVAQPRAAPGWPTLRQ